MSIPLPRFALLFTAVFALSACDSVADMSYDEGVPTHDTSLRQNRDDAQRRPVPRATCPCFNRQTLANVPDMFTSIAGVSSDPYLFFDVFNYYDLDARRTEARSTLRTGEGTFEEVAAVYITPDNDGLHLICHRQEVIRDTAVGDLTYRYETLSPTVEEAEACRQDITAFVGEQEPCQGAACGIPYSKGQLDPDYPPYHDEGFRTPNSILDTMHRKIEDVSRMIRLPA